jgi:signal transduction histidine kinase
MSGGIPAVGLAVLATTSAGALLSFALAWVAWQHLTVPSSGLFAGAMAASGLWSLAYTCMLLLRPPWGLVAHNLQTIGAMAVPLLWLLFILEYTGHGRWVNRRLAAVLAVEPTIFYILFWTPGAHTRLVRGPIQYDVSAGLVVYYIEKVPGTLIHVAYTYALVVLALGFLVVFLLRTRNLYRRQAAIITTAGILTVLGNLLYLGQRGNLHPRLHPQLDLTVVFFAVNGLVIAWALSSHDFLDVVPLAPDQLIQEMGDAMVVLDEDDVIVAHNPAATALSAVPDPTGAHVEDAVPGLQGALAEETSLSLPETSREPTTTDGGSSTTAVYDPESTPIYDRHEIYRGRVVVLRDVTVRERRQERMAALQFAVKQFLDATTKADIADITVDIANDVLAYPFAGILLTDDAGERLVSVELTPAVRDHLDDGEMVIERGDNVVWEIYQSGEPAVFDPRDEPRTYGQLPVEEVFIHPLGDHGVLGVGSRSQERFDSDDRQFLVTLAGAAESALDRAERQSQLRESQQTVRERNEQLEFFNQLLRHDILNGMTVIDGNLVRLSDHVDADGEQYLETIRDWSGDITDLTRRVRAVMNALTAEDRNDRRQVDLATELADSLSKFDDTFPDATVDADFPAELPVLADELVSEVVGNLLHNAIEHNDTEEPLIEVDTETTDETVRLSIVDNGPGLSDEMKECAFEQAVTSDDSGSVGFGLYFVKVMMDDYGGDVWAEDRAPRGTRFVLEFRRPFADGRP